MAVEPPTEKPTPSGSSSRSALEPQPYLRAFRARGLTPRARSPAQRQRSSARQRPHARQPAQHQGAHQQEWLGWSSRVPGYQAGERVGQARRQAVMTCPKAQPLLALSTPALFTCSRSACSASARSVGNRGAAPWAHTGPPMPHAPPPQAPCAHRIVSDGPPPLQVGAPVHSQTEGLPALGILYGVLQPVAVPRARHRDTG